MPQIEFHILRHDDHSTMQLIAEWYLSEWKRPIADTLKKLQDITADPTQFQVIMIIDGAPISTGGLYHRLTIHDKLPRLGIYQNWLALVYTIPEMRHQGYGAVICKYIQEHAKNIGVEHMYLYTSTAENLYIRLGWEVMERMEIEGRELVVMELGLRLV